MTETLHTAIERLLQSLEEQGDNATGAEQADLLRARLLADFSQALEGKTTATGDGLSFVNEIAAHLDGFPLGAGRDAFIAALAKSANDRSALQSAALFLRDLTGEAQPVSSVVFNDAMTAFAPEMPRVPAEAAAARASRAPSSGWNFGQARGLATFAVLFLVGLIGGREISHIIQASHAPATSPSATTQSLQPAAPPQPNATHSEAIIKNNPLGKRAVGGLAPSEKDCDAGVPQSDQLATRTLSNADSVKNPTASAGKAPCRPSTQGAVPAGQPQPNLPSGADQH
jgi:hypothetical protein